MKNDFLSINRIILYGKQIDISVWAAVHKNLSLTLLIEKSEVYLHDTVTDGYEQARGGGGGYSQENWVGVCGPLPKTLTLFMTKICGFPYPIYDLTKNLIPNL